MSDVFHPKMRSYLLDLLVELTAPVVLSFDADWRLTAISGDLELYGRGGDDPDGVVSLIREMFAGTDPSRRHVFSSVELPNGSFAHVHLVPDAPSHHVLLIDASAEMTRERTIQQSANEAKLASHWERQRTEQELRATTRRLRTQLERLRLLDRTTRAIGERRDLKSIFQVVIQSLEDHLSIDFSCMCLYDPVDQVLTVTCVGARSEPLASALALRERESIEINCNDLSRCVRGQFVYVPDVSDSEFAFPQRLARGGLRSLVIAPLVIESSVFGVMIAARREPTSFESADCEFLRQLSEHTALAAHQAHLYNALQQAYEDLRQTQKTVVQQERLRALGQMASGIAHDINNALSPAALYTQSLLEKDASLSPRSREYLEIIQRAIDAVAQTVARMREFYRQHEPQLTMLPVALSGTLGHVIDLTRARWRDMPQERGIVICLETDFAANLPAVLGIENELGDAFTNLILNAVDAMPAGGTLTVRSRFISGESGGKQASSPRSAVCVEICDTGIGMSEETRSRCLEPFFTTKGERGTGLGLAMVYGMVQRHGADLEIESAPGAGTTMRLIFPVVSAEPGRSDRVADTPRPARRLRILLVEDDPLVRETLWETLERDGHAVLAADGGRAGIDAFCAAERRAEPFDVVITDLGMPHVDGRKVASAVKAASASTPVILLTGWGHRLLTDSDIPEHVDRVVSKPPKLTELRMTLAELVGENTSHGL